MSVTSESGAFCSAPCFPGTVSAQCPGDFPNGTTATPTCAIRDMIGQGSHCALTCSTDADCGGENNTLFKCMEAYNTKFCSYTKTTEIKLVWGTACPTGRRNSTRRKEWSWRMLRTAACRRRRIMSRR